MNEEREPARPTADAEHEAEEARLLEDLAAFEEELPHGKPAAVRDRALAIVYEDEARFLKRRGPSADDRNASSAPDTTPEPGHDPAPGTAAS
ncbi:MAG TPA: hypothetical protein VFD49_13320 [Candidatus Dormibacteraeota bacterium]|nr:hypothetical protein [Candidatus Dormibacteraeota bacterium]